MTNAPPNFASFASAYSDRLAAALRAIPTDAVGKLSDALFQAWTTRRQVFLFGNGGSAGNAIHIANDLIYGIAKTFGSGIRVNALPANSSVVTCLANDLGYESIFVNQLAVLAEPGDIAIALSGSGNSPNIVRALEYCRTRGIESYAILGYSGGKALNLATTPIHIPVDDMQIAEDLQLIIGHMVMQWLYQRRGDVAAKD